MRPAAALGMLLVASGSLCAQEDIRLQRDARGRVVATNTRGGAYAGARTVPAHVSPQPAASHGSQAAAVPRQLGPLIRQAARRHGVSPDLIRAVVAVESGFDPRAVSPRGARGLMQLMPATAAELNVYNVYDPAQNLDGGTRHLRGLLDRFDGDLRLALAAYNAGSEAVRHHGGVPPYPETREYVRKVLQRLAHGGSGQSGPRNLTPYRDSRGHLVLTNMPQPAARKAGQ